MKQLNFLALLTFEHIDNIEPLKDRITSLFKCGFDGFVLNPDVGCGELRDSDLAAIDEAILFAKSLGMAAWLAVSSKLSPDTDMPFCNIMWLEYSGGVIKKRSLPGSITPFHEVCTYELIAKTYERYKTCLSKEAFSYLTGFTGKLENEIPRRGSSCVPWYDGLEADFMNRYNIDINPFLIELFEDRGHPVKFRARLRQMLADRFSDSFSAPINAWCRENGKKFFLMFNSGMTPIKQVDVCGSHIQMNRPFEIPSVSINSPKSNGCFYPYAAGSIARQFGNGEAAASVFTQTGWGLSPDEFEDCLSRLIESGISTFVIHNSFLRSNYEVLSRHLISFPENVPWKNALPKIFGGLRDMANTEQVKAHKILVVCPSRGIWENYVPGSSQEDLPQRFSDNIAEICDRLREMQRQFDVTDEVIFEKDVEFADEHMRLGAAQYTTLLMAPGCSFSKKGMVAIEKAKAYGVRILNDIPKSDTEIIPLDVIKDGMREIVPVLIHQDNWTITLPSRNCLPLKTERTADGMITCTFNAMEIPDSPITLLVTDSCETVSINNILAERADSGSDGGSYSLSGNIVVGRNQIVLSGCQNTFAYLIGSFKAESLSGYRGFDSRQIQTHYDFAIKNTGIEAETNLIRCGYPFGFEPAAAKKIIYSEETVNKPRIKADCSGCSMIEVLFDNQFIGFAYGAKNILPLPPLTAGEQHVVEIRCYPSAFNIYGDRYYVAGDTGIAPDKSDPDYRTDLNIKLVNGKIPRDIEIIQEF